MKESAAAKDKRLVRPPSTTKGEESGGVVDDSIDGEKQSNAGHVTDTAASRFEALHKAISSRAVWLFPLLTTIFGIVPAMWAMRAQTFAIFGRDQGIFQYVAWALRHGERTYRDIHEINGPLPHAWHMMMQALGGEDEHVFRSIDAWMLVTVYSLASMTIPRWVGLDLDLRLANNDQRAANTREDGRHRRRGVGPRMALFFWVLAGLTVLGSQYARFDWWHTAQREALYSMLILSSLALQAIVHTTKSAKRARIALFVAGMTTSLTWFGKPPCAIFAVLQLVVLWLDRKSIAPVVSLRAALGIVFGGAVVAGLSMLAFVLAYEDIGRGIELLSKVPRLHHTIWNETLLGGYRAYNNAPRLDWAIATFVGFVIVYVRLKLPTRSLLACVLPVGGIIVFAGQGKAFPYHLHMVTLGTGFMQLIILAAVAQYVQATPTATSKSFATRWLAALAALGALSLGGKSAQDALLSPGVRGEWSSAGATAELRTTHGYFDHFPWGDFFANDLRSGAAYVAFHTRPDERVQTYGFDPYFLFLARRKSASPVIYNFELNVDAALEGGPGARPSPELKEWLVAYRDDAERLVLGAVDKSPPAAFALFDRAPWTFPPDADRDFEKHCPKLHQWMTEHYVPAATFGTVRIWLRRDVMARSASSEHP